MIIQFRKSNKHNFERTNMKTGDSLLIFLPTVVAVKGVYNDYNLGTWGLGTNDYKQGWRISWNISRYFFEEIVCVAWRGDLLDGLASNIEATTIVEAEEVTQGALRILSPYTE